MKVKDIKGKDLNYLIIKDKHGKAIIRKWVYSSIFFNFLLIAAQIAIFVLFLVRLQPYIEFYFGGSILLSATFMIYLSNCKGKNEFKITWLVPMVVFPLFGVLAYIMYHTNWGGRAVGRRLKHVKNQTDLLLPDVASAETLLISNEDIAGLGRYLINKGRFYPHSQTKVQYFSSGENFLPDLYNSLKSAKKFIFLEFFIIDVDESWAFLLECLEQKASDGVEVRIIYDGLGSPMASSKSYQKYLAKRGIKSHIFQPLVPFFNTKQNNRDHRKIVVIDGEIAYTGGLNLSNEYFNEGENRFAYWKDNAIRIEGPAIRNLTTMFLQTWNIQTHKEDDYAKYISLPYKTYNESGIVIPYGDDAYNHEDIAEDVYLYILDNARKYVHITTPYMIIDNQMMETLIFAAQRGLDVSIIVPSVPDHFLAFCIGKTYLKTLVESGVHVYLYEKGFIHAKTFIADDNTATVGSVNLDYRSFFHHFECGTVMHDLPVIKEIEQDFQETLKDCVEMKKEDYKKIPSRIRLLGRVFRIFAPLL